MMEVVLIVFMDVQTLQRLIIVCLQHVMMGHV